MISEIIFAAIIIAAIFFIIRKALIAEKEQDFKDNINDSDYSN